MALTLKSTAFSNGAEIPRSHTCEGADMAPPLEWSGAPSGTKSFALIVDDPDAPDPKAPKMTYVHWVLYDISPGTNLLAGKAPAGARDGLNDWKRTGYGGAGPPTRGHRGFFPFFSLGRSGG